ncbi:MAG: preprotein translocase subunit SecG [Thermoanaerobaculia bacterium]
MIYVLYTLHIIICIFLILVVLLQQGKGADLSVFGGGTTMAAFGARSATNLLHRMTVGAFVAFILTTLGIAYLKGHVEGSSVMKRAKAAAPVSAPATVPATTPPTAPAPAPATAPASPAPGTPAPQQQ